MQWTAMQCNVMRCTHPAESPPPSPPPPRRNLILINEARSVCTYLNFSTDSPPAELRFLFLCCARLPYNLSSICFLASCCKS